MLQNIHREERHRAIHEVTDLQHVTNDVDPTQPLQPETDGVEALLPRVRRCLKIADHQNKSTALGEQNNRLAKFDARTTTWRQKHLADFTSQKHPSRSTGSPRDNGAVFLHRTTHRDQLNQAKHPSASPGPHYTKRSQKCPCQPRHEGANERHRRTQQMMNIVQSGALTRAVKNPAREIEHTTQGTNAKPRQKGWREDNHTYTKCNAGPS